MKKKIIITLIVIVCILGLGAGGIYIYKQHSKNSNPIDVYSVQDFVGGWYGNEQMIDGYVTSNDEQSVYVDNDKVIKEMLVTPGDEVHVGDVLLKYDTTLLELQVEKQKTQIEVYKTNIKLAEKELKELENTTPVEPEEPTEPEIPVGTPGDAGYEPPADDDGTDPDDMTITYTKEELDMAISSKKAEIRDAKLQLQMAELQLKQQQRTVDQGTVISKMDGVVQIADDSEENIASGKPVVVVSGDGTFSVVATVGEWSLDKMPVGKEVSLYCYETGETYIGMVTEISLVPTDNYYSQLTETGYPVTISIQGAGDLREDMWMEVTLDGESSMMMGENDDIVLPMALVRQENGNYYVMKQDGDRLKKQYVKTGKIYYGTEIEIQAGITPDDYIAFPYDKNAVEGKKCKVNPNGIYY